MSVRVPGMCSVKLLHRFGFEAKFPNGMSYLEREQTFSSNCTFASLLNAYPSSLLSKTMIWKFYGGEWRNPAPDMRYQRLLKALP